MKDSERFDILVTYAESIGWHVEVESDEDESDRGPRLITVNQEQTGRARVHALLHEIGHALQSTDEGRLFKKGSWADLECEIDAWVRGWALAERLQLGLSRRGYRRTAASCLVTYARHLPNLRKP